MEFIANEIESENKQIGRLEVTGKKEFAGEVNYEGDGGYTNITKGQTIKSTSGRYILEISEFKVEGTTNYAQVKIYHKSFGEYKFAGYILALEGVRSSRTPLPLTVIAIGIDPINNNMASLEFSE